MPKKLQTFLGIMLMATTVLMAQNPPTVSAEIDTLNAQIGQAISYRLKVVTDTLATVKFPEGQTFAPFETLEAFDVDTLRQEAQVSLMRRYALIQFDSGTYTLPPQTVLINNKIFKTNSFKVQINSIEVDTVSKQFYDIKPIVMTSKNNIGWWKPYVFSFLALLAIGLLTWIILKRKKVIEARKRNLPPFERAIQALQNIEAVNLSAQEDYKVYYSQLTDIVRTYIEDDVHIDALESTTEELIQKMEMLCDAGKLSLKKETVANFKSVLQTADLVKFARANPGLGVAQADRKALETVIVETKEALPEPTEEELRQNEEYLEKLRKQQRKNRLKMASILSGSVLVLALIIGISIFGFEQVKDSLFGHPTRKLLKQNWITSTYGAHPTTLSFPDALVRTKQGTPTRQEFEWGSLEKTFYARLSVEQFPQEAEKFDLQKAVDAIIGQYEKIGGKNIILKQDEFTASDGSAGLNAYGSFEWSEAGLRKEYSILNFAQGGGFQQLELVFDQEDQYAKAIVERIQNSITFKTEKTP